MSCYVCWFQPTFFLRKLKIVVTCFPKESCSPQVYKISSKITKLHRSDLCKARYNIEKFKLQIAFLNMTGFCMRFPKSAFRVRAFFHKTVRVCHVYCNFKIGFTCWITIIFGILKDGSLLNNTLASNIWFSYRNIFQNGVDALPKIVDAFLSKSTNFHLVRIIR